MAAGLFTITELRRQNGATLAAADAERFEWSADSEMPGPRGGARAAPVGTWSLAMVQATVRTNYPGARTPSVQVLGVRRQPFTLTGRWDDRWNFPGYADAELRRFEAMFHRGNVCRFAFQNQVIDGLIVEFSPEYKGEWLIRYSITVDAHGRPDEYEPNRSPPGPLTPAQRFDDTAIMVAVLQDFADACPDGKLAGTLAADARSDMADTTAARDQLGATLDQRDLRPSAQAAGSLPRLATQFRALGEAAQAQVDRLVSVRSDLDLALTTAESVLRFEDWSRSIRYNGRILMGRAAAGADDMDERSSPAAERLYQPSAGESLYAISRRFYGTPHGWRAIAARNGLSTFTLTGAELLIIPEREAG